MGWSEAIAAMWGFVGGYWFCLLVGRRLRKRLDDSASESRSV